MSMSDHRKDLVAERTRVQNRLRWHLLELCGELEQSLRRGALERPRQLDRIDRCLRRLPAGARVRVAREQIVHLCERRELRPAGELAVAAAVPALCRLSTGTELPA